MLLNIPLTWGNANNCVQNVEKSPKRGRTSDGFEGLTGVCYLNPFKNLVVALDCPTSFIHVVLESKWLQYDREKGWQDMDNLFNQGGHLLAG